MPNNIQARCEGLRWCGAVRRACRAGLVGLLLVAVPGCFTQKINVVVHPDGSAHVLVTQVYPREIIAEGRGAGGDSVMISIEGNVPVMPPRESHDPFFNEERLKDQAVMYGPDVEFVEARRVDEAGVQGSVALYSIKDINQLRIPLDGSLVEMTGTAVEDPDEESDYEPALDPAITFSMSKTEPYTLRIHLPDLMVKAVGRQKERQAAAANAPAALPVVDSMIIQETAPIGVTDNDEMAAAAKLVKQMKLSVSVEVKGRVTDTNAGHPVAGRPGRYNLYALDFAKLPNLAAPDLLNDMPDQSEFFETALGFPGAVVETNATVTIVFEPEARP